MAHYDSFYKKQTREEIEKEISEKSSKLDKIINEYKELVSDIEKNLSPTGIKVLKNELRNLSTSEILCQRGLDKMKELLVRFDNGEEITYEQILNHY
jgi:hypothetical protein